MAAGSPGGVVNAVSKLPLAEPIRYIEAGVNSFGNADICRSISAAAPSFPPAAARWITASVGTVKGGGTQVDFARDDSYYFAPSVTYRPDLDTRITVLAQGSRDRTNGNNWLPYEGSVTSGAVWPDFDQAVHQRTGPGLRQARSER